MNLGQLFVLATTNTSEASIIIRKNQSEYDERLSRITKRFWNTVELLAESEDDPRHAALLQHQLVVQDYIEEYLFEAERSPIMYRSDREKFYTRREGLRTCENYLKRFKLDARLIRERIKASIRAD